MPSLLCVCVALAACARPATAGETVYAPEDASREVRFANPPASARILPLKHYRGLDQARVLEGVRRLHRQGFGGMATEVAIDRGYLDDAGDWEVFRAEIAEMRRLGMSIWIYDEKGYPSGTAGGRTLDGHPEWRARGWLVAVTNGPAGRTAAVPLPGRAVATLRRPSGDGETVFSVSDAYLDESFLAPVVGETLPKPYINVLMKEPVARFLELTHERYVRELGEAFGSVTAMFTDEPSLKTVWERDIPYAVIPVSDGLIRAYRAKTGRNLEDDVPEIVAGEAVGETAAKRHLFWSLVAERVASNYFGQIAAWTRAHGVLSGGHLFDEEGGQFHVGLYGDFFRALRRLESPGCDMLTSVPRRMGWCAPGLAGSAGELNGARRVMSESSDIGDRRPGAHGLPSGYRVSPREIVGALNRQIGFGVNTFTSYYRWDLTGFDDGTIRGINLEIGRAVTLMTEGRTAADIAILYPADSLMVGYEPRPGRFKVGGPAERTGILFRECGTWLINEKRPFMVVDASSVAEADVRDGALVRGPLKWRIVVLPAVSTIPLAAAERLAEFVRSGGTVFALEGLPVNSTERFPDARLQTLTRDWIEVPHDRLSTFIPELRNRHVPALRVVEGKMLRFAAHRHTDEGDTFLVLNESDEVAHGTVSVGDGRVAVRVWSPQDGTVSIPVKGVVPLDIPAWGAAILTTAERIGSACELK